MDRKKKVFKLNYHVGQGNGSANIAIMDNPNEVRISANPKTFISVTEDGLSLSGGTPSTINIQGMSSSMKYGGMIQDLPFPMSIMPVTTFNPFPKQIFAPPLKEMIPTLTQAAALASSLIGL